MAATKNSTVARPPVSIGRLKAREKQHFTIGIFGPSGAGKSTCQTTAVENPEELLIVNIDNSITTISGDYLVFPDPALGRPVESWEEFMEFFNWLESGGYKELGITTISFDTMTELGSGLLRKWILSQPPRIGTRPSQGSFNQSDYGWFADIFLDLLRRIRDLPLNKVLLMQTADQTYETPEGQVQLIRYPSFGEGQKTNREAAQFVDMMGYLSVVPDEQTGKVNRTLLVYPLANRAAKIRTKPGVEAPLVFENPNLFEIIQNYMVINGE